MHAAVEHYVASIPYGWVLSTAQHISTDLNLRAVSEAEMAAALAHRDEATTADRDVYASYILEAFLTALERTGSRIVFQFSIGAEPLPYETGSKLRQDTIFEVAELAARHPALRFQVFLASEHANQAFCTLVRELPNISLAGFWWHNLFPGIIRKVMARPAGHGRPQPAGRLLQRRLLRGVDLREGGRSSGASWPTCWPARSPRGSTPWTRRSPSPARSSSRPPRSSTA